MVYKVKTTTTREEWERRAKKKSKVGVALTKLGKIFKIKKYS